MDGGPPLFPRGFTCPAVLWILPAVVSFRLRDSHPLWSAFPCRSTNLSSLFAVRTPDDRSLPVWPPPRSLATTCGISVDVFSSPYLDVSVQAVPHLTLFYSDKADRAFSAGFPHSDICGSRCICHSPQLFAACHVLLRLLMPRHSPCALLSLTICDVLARFSELCKLYRSFCVYCSFTLILPLRLSSTILLLFCRFAFLCLLFSFQGALPSLKPDSNTRVLLGCLSLSSSGGEYRNRTDDLLRAKQALSHLS